MKEARLEIAPELGDAEVRVSQHVHPSGFRMDAHVHSFHEIGYVIAGRGRYETPQGFVPVSGGCLLLWSGRVAHRAVDEAGDPLHQVIVIVADAVLTGRAFYPVLADLFSRGEPVMPAEGRAGPSLELLVRRIAAEGRDPRMGRADMLAALVVELCVAVYRRAAEPGSPCPGEADPRIAPVLRDIRARYFHALGPEAYARGLGISVRRFSELFRRATGRTFTEYLAGVRVARARELLLETDDKVVNVAFEAGFGNLSHFDRTFKRISGLSPQEFRKAQGRLP